MDVRRYCSAAAAVCLCLLSLSACGPFGTTSTSPESTLSASACRSGRLKGIFQFSGTPQVDNPNLAGGVVIVYWAQIEPQDGQYNWTILDQKIAQWTSRGKKVIVRIPFSSSYDKVTPSATPQWVYNLGVQQVTEVDGSIHPQYWNPIFLAKLKEFITSFGARYDGNPSIVYVNAATGNDGETIVDGNGLHGHTATNSTNRLELWQQVGYSDPVWWSTIQQILGYYKQAFTRTPLAAQVDSTFIGNTPGYTIDTVLSYVASQGMWLQSDGESPGKPLSDPAWHSTTLVLEPNENSKQQGSTLAANLTNMVNQNATYALVFGSDLHYASNQQALTCTAQAIATAR